MTDLKSSHPSDHITEIEFVIDFLRIYNARGLRFTCALFVKASIEKAFFTSEYFGVPARKYFTKKTLCLVSVLTMLCFFGTASFLGGKNISPRTAVESLGITFAASALLHSCAIVICMVLQGVRSCNAIRKRIRCQTHKSAIYPVIQEMEELEKRKKR